MIRTLAFAAILLMATAPAEARLSIIGLPKVGDGPATMRTGVAFGLAMTPGDETIFLDGPDGKQIADLILQADPLLNRPERKAEALAPGLHALKAYTDTMTPASEDAPATLNASELLDLAGPILAAHPGKGADILLWGSVNFTAPRALSDKSYRGTFPSDGLLVDDRSTSPFGTRGHRDLDGANVWDCFTEAPSDFISAEHLERMKRAWALLIGLRGGRLVAFSGDQKSCLDRFRTKTSDPITFSLDAGDVKVLKMYRPQEAAPQIINAAPIKSTAPIMRAPPPERRGEAARFDQPGRTTPPHTRQGVAWLGIKWPDPIDLDIYVRCRPTSPFLFYGHQLTPEGRHNFDYRAGTGDAFETVDLTAPCPDISKAEAYVNFYSGRTANPPTGVFAIQFDGGIYKAPFELEATEGNSGRLAPDGTMSGPEWVRIDLPSVLHLDQGFTPIPAQAANTARSSKLVK